MSLAGYFHISNTDNDAFNEAFEKAVNKLQSDGQDVEIQYRVNTFDNGQVLYSVLIIGRK